MAMRDPRRSKPSKKELELSERAKREPEKVRREIVTDQEKRRIVGQYGLDIEDYDDLMKMGPRPQRETFSGLTGTVPYMMDDHRSAAWDKRLKELQDRAVKRRSAKKQREVEDYDATIRGEKTPTQIEAEEKVKQPPVPAVQPSAPALNPASGAKRAAAPSRTPLVSVNRNDRTGTTVTLNGQGMRPTAENLNAVTEAQRRQLLDAPTGVDVTSPLYTNAEVRLMRRRAAESQMFRDQVARLDKIESEARARADARAWENGSLRGERDWKHYGEVANTGGDGWKKGGSDYTNAMSALRDKMETLTGLARQGLLHGNDTVTVTNAKGETYKRDGRNPYQVAMSLGKMILDSERGAGLSQKQFEVANAQIDRLTELAQDRQRVRDRREQYRADEIRRRLPAETANATTNAQVFAAEKAYNAGRRTAALRALASPDVWDTPELYDHLNVINSTSTVSPAGANGVGRINDVQSAFREAMKDPAMNKAYASRARALEGKPGSEYDLEDLQNRIGVIYMQGKAGIKPVSYDRQVPNLDDAVWAEDDGNPAEKAADSMSPGSVPYGPAPDPGALTPAIRTPQVPPRQEAPRIEDELRPVMAATKAGDAGGILRPRRKGVA